jgi:pyrroloquinoline quinone biosynthesis protein B
MRTRLLCGLFLILFSCKENTSNTQTASQYITVLGTAQDGGYPHIGCPRECCAAFYEGKVPSQKVVSLGLIDQIAQQKFLFEATPNISTQLDDLERNHLKTSQLIDGIFLTHAHMGHYSGLLYLGREALGKKDIPVYAMPRMKRFLQENGPWSQLLDLQNITLLDLQQDSTLTVTSQLKVTPFLVPHRDEFSETVGYKIEGPKKSALFIPDINKWELWKKDIVQEVKKVDYAFLDATFFKDGEINRPMSEIPHPFIEETVALFENESEAIKQKVIFIHFNHTNPTLQPNAKERKLLEAKGFRFATEGDQYPL